MGRRWSVKEEEMLKELRRRLAPELAQQLPFPEVVGDRRLIRFIRGKSVICLTLFLNLYRIYPLRFQVQIMT